MVFRPFVFRLPVSAGIDLDQSSARIDDRPVDPGQPLPVAAPQYFVL
jgi:hypothetical protein